MIKIADTNFNSFIVTNLRPCVSNRLIVLVKVPAPVTSSSKGLLLSSRTIVDMYSDFESLGNAQFSACIL